MPSATVIYNPSAGRFPAAPLIHRATRVLGSAGWHILLLETTGGDDLIQRTQRAVDEGDDGFFVAEGDGSAGKVAPVVVGRERQNRERK